MIYTKSIQVDIAHQYLNDVIRLHEGDASGAQLQISMFNNGAAFSLTGFTVKFDAVIAGYLAEQDAAATVSSNMITVPITANMCAKSGTLEIDVKIIEGSGNNAHTFYLQKFEAFVQRRVINEDIIIDVSGTTIGEKIAALEDKFPIKTEDIENGAITHDKMDLNSVGLLELRELSVSTEKIVNKAVTTDKLANAAVTTGKIDGSAVTEAKIADAAVTTAKIADGNVTTDKLSSGAVTSGKISSGAVTSGKLDGGAVTTAKIADAAVTKAKLGSDVKEVYMLLADEVGTMSLAEALENGQAFLYTTDKMRVLFKVGSNTYITLARQDDLSALASLVGDANDLLESALNYQN